MRGLGGEPGNDKYTRPFEEREMMQDSSSNWNGKWVNEVDDEADACVLTCSSSGELPMCALQSSPWKE